MQREIRLLKNAELRTSGTKRIEGYGVVFNSQSEDLGGFTEKIAPAAFSASVKNGDIRLLSNHVSSAVLGRTKSKTLRLSEDSTGIRFSCDLPDTQAARDLLTSISRGDIAECSFAFSCRKDQWNGNVRTVLDGDLFEISPVTFAAYSQTSVSARTLWPNGAPASVREHRTSAPVNSGAYIRPGRVLDDKLELSRMRAQLRLSAFDL